MQTRLALLAVAVLFASFARAAAPLKVLVITGGCCHDYQLQAAQLEAGLRKLTPLELTVVNEGGTGTRGQIKLYDDPNWAQPYDVVVHNECFADTDDLAYVQKITAAHKAGKPAVVIHCAMHSYRAAKFDDWREFLGVTSRRHDHQSQYPVTPVAKGHPALKGFPEKWTTPMDELYVIEKIGPTTRALATAVSEADGQTYPTVWTSDYHGARVFGTTFGHSNATWHDPVFLEMISRGVLWAAGRN